LLARNPSPDLFDNLPEALSPVVAKQVAMLARVEGADERGAVFTRPEVVRFILDLAGYRLDQPLHELRLLEPSFGGGEFLLAAAERLIAAWRAAGSPGSALQTLGNALVGVELHGETFDETRRRLTGHLLSLELDEETAQSLADRWLVRGDFLLESIEGRFDFVVGNPPYVRQELIPNELLREYKRRYTTIYNRADLYVPFIERSLRLLGEGGRLGFICSDRWMKNRYGAPLRRLVADHFGLQIFVDMVDTPAFFRDVIAYPAITVIGPERGGATRVARRPKIAPAALSDLARRLTCLDPVGDSDGVRELQGIVNGDAPWLLDADGPMALLRRLEARYPTLEEAGCKVGIGVATGADKAFIGAFDELDVEPDRKLSLVRTQDIQSGEVRWRGDGVINPFADGGGLVDLAEYPKLAAYLEARREVIAVRHCAKKNPSRWYRTIDRIFPALAGQPKLLIPDIKGEAHIVYEAGRYYPHHNLYYIISDSWDLHALQAVLLSGIARLFVASYSTRMRGGYLRFQAQYLRRIRIPAWEDVSSELQNELRDAAIAGDPGRCNLAVAGLYGLTDEERGILEGGEEPCRAFLRQQLQQPGGRGNWHRS
jgi:hypothetical protein